MANISVMYLTQTGNTKKVAEYIAQGLQTGGNSIKLISFKKVKPNDFQEADLIGIGVPVFYFRPPYSIMNYLQSLYPLNGGKKGFIFLTSGGNPGNTLWRLQQILEAKGVQILDGIEILGKDTHQLYDAREKVFQAAHPLPEELEEARQFGLSLLRKYENARAGHALPSPMFHKKDSTWARLLRYQDLNNDQIFPKRVVNEEKCTQCGVCAEECHCAAIALNPFPVFNKECDRCYWCERVCPTKAIECDWRKQIAMFERLREDRGKRKGID